MSIISAKDHGILLQTALGTLADDIGTGGLNFAVLQSMNELGWAYPLTHAKREFWAIQRAKRHALDLLRTIAASKFQYKQIHLNQRFDHYDNLIKEWDSEFQDALKTESILVDVDPSKLFGTYVTNGFIYDQNGNDLTKLCHDYGIDNDGYRTRHC